MPIRPPSEASTTASIRNCSSTSRSSAPMARRMPISRVRSVTLTSMMFMMPMPPTSRLTAATAPSSVVITLVVPDRVSASCLVSSTLKLSSSVVGQLAALAQQLGQAGLDAVGSRCRPHRHQQGVDAGVAGDAALQRLDRHQHHVVLVVANGALALGGQHADHLAGDLL